MRTIKEKLEDFAKECREGNDGAWREGGLRKAHLVGANLEGANLRSTNLQGADLTGANLKGANLRAVILYDVRLQGADLTGADLDISVLDCAYLEGSKGFRFDGAPDPQALRVAVADQIEANPELHNQGEWGEGNPDECGTPCCVAGWACRLGGGTRGKEVSDAATRLLHVDGKKMPSFHHEAKREDILAALRA